MDMDDAHYNADHEWDFGELRSRVREEEPELPIASIAITLTVFTVGFSLLPQVGYILGFFFGSLAIGFGAWGYHFANDRHHLGQTSSLISIAAGVLAFLFPVFHVL